MNERKKKQNKKTNKKKNEKRGKNNKRPGLILYKIYDVTASQT